MLPHRLLLDAYTDQVRPLMEWALTDREEFTWPQWQWPVSNLGSYVVGTLGAVPVDWATEGSRRDEGRSDPAHARKAVNRLKHRVWVQHMRRRGALMGAPLPGRGCGSAAVAEGRGD